MANVLYLFFIMLMLVENPTASSTSGDGFRLTLTHVDSAAGPSFTLAERIQRAVRRSYSRKRAIEAKRNVVVPVSYGGESEYLVSFGIGSPALPVTAILDTGSDLIWTQCVPCFESIPQPSPLYNSFESSSYARIPCSNPFCSDASSILSSCGSSGTFMTILNQPGYDVLRKELIKQARLPLAESPGQGFDLCFSLKKRNSAPRMPELVFHFDGADMRFQRDKYMIYDPEVGLVCSAIAGTEGLSILGNYQQQDMHILYDLKANVLSFVPANCDRF